MYQRRVLYNGRTGILAKRPTTKHPTVHVIPDDLPDTSESWPVHETEVISQEPEMVDERIERQPLMLIEAIRDQVQ